MALKPILSISKECKACEGEGTISLVCSYCAGTGGEDDFDNPCESCYGHGYDLEACEHCEDGGLYMRTYIKSEQFAQDIKGIELTTPINDRSFLEAVEACFNKWTNEG